MPKKETDPLVLAARKERRRVWRNRYITQWAGARKQAWFRESGPCKNCGSWENLEVDHIDPSQKVTHKVWHWKKEKRDAELKKCQPLCKSCHRKKSYAYFSERFRGRSTGMKTPKEKALEYLDLIDSGVSSREASKVVGIPRGTLSTMKYQAYWRELVTLRSSVKAARRPVKS